MNKKMNYVKIAFLTIILADLVKNTIKKNKVTIATESFVIPREAKTATDSDRRLVEAASRYCKR
ncbi:hypothetical protein [Staphylococcus pasteuri]|uniref:hypothetical protein n=1 Tax=Staphylococcus pasteuri TaxID=45972 RepID=UPI00115B5B43|nr:hypothetical protein [Staphylococcus pasteuri]MEB7433305.1 hypothetical protein [Staphylococcus pasteuri]